MKKLSRYTYLSLFITLLILVLILFVGTLNFVVRDKTPPHWDYAGNLVAALDYRNSILNHQYGLLVSSYYYYPPFLYYVMAMFFMIFTYSKTTVVFFNSVFLAVFLVIVYRYFCKITGRVASLGAVLLAYAVMLTPSTFNVKIWEFMLDFPMAVVVITTYFFFSESINQKHFTVKNAVFLGVLSAISLLMKWTAGVFLVIPICFYCYGAFKNRSIHIALLLLCVIFIASGWWYFYHFSILIPQMNYFAWDEGVLNHDPQGFQGGIYYSRKIFGALGLASLLLGVWLVSSMRIAIKKVASGFYKGKYTNFYTGATILFPFIIFSIIWNKNERYLYPLFILLPLLAFRHIMRVFPASQKFVTLGIICFAFYRFSTYLPVPMVEPTAFSTLQKFLLDNKSRSVGYFFEDDTSFFNYSNVALAYKELYEFPGRQAPYYYLNSHAEQRTTDQCVMGGPVDTIIVYGGWGNITDPNGQHASFFKSCGRFFGCYQLARAYDFAHEKMDVYERKGTCATEPQ